MNTCTLCGWEIIPEVDEVCPMWTYRRFWRARLERWFR